MIDSHEQENSMKWLLEEHDRMKELIAELQADRESSLDLEPTPRVERQYAALAAVVVLLSYLYGITLGVYMCPK